MDEEVADLTRFLLILLSGLWIEYTRALIFMEYTVQLLYEGTEYVLIMKLCI